jgi:hypothetical protein
LHYGVDDRVSALCLSIFAMLGVAMLGAAAIARISRRQRRVPEAAVE